MPLLSLLSHSHLHLLALPLPSLSSSSYATPVADAATVLLAAPAAVAAGALCSCWWLCCRCAPPSCAAAIPLCDFWLRSGVSTGCCALAPALVAALTLTCVFVFMCMGSVAVAAHTLVLQLLCRYAQPRGWHTRYKYVLIHAVCIRTIPVTLLVTV